MLVLVPTLVLESVTPITELSSEPLLVCGSGYGSGFTMLVVTQRCLQMTEAELGLGWGGWGNVRGRLQLIDKTVYALLIIR